MSNHTPGPWTYELYNDTDTIEINGPESQVVIAGSRSDGTPFGDNLKHDGPLIAAAPDLLRVLEIEQEWLDSDINTEDFRKKLQIPDNQFFETWIGGVRAAAIAKARGASK